MKLLDIVGFVLCWNLCHVFFKGVPIDGLIGPRVPTLALTIILPEITAVDVVPNGVVEVSRETFATNAYADICHGKMLDPLFGLLAMMFLALPCR